MLTRPICVSLLIPLLTAALHADEPLPPTIASLSPAATDLIIGMGAAEQLIAVSNYDPDRPELRSLPRVGDYQTTDWERLATLRPGVMIIQMAPDRVPPGLRQRAERFGIRLVNVRIDRLEDVFAAINTLGEAIGREEEATAHARSLRQRLEAVRERVHDRPAVSTLLVLDTAGGHIAGPQSYLDDLLAYAGGNNAAAHFQRPYPTIDREILAALAPEAIVQLLPGATAPIIEQAQRTWQAAPAVPAVRNQRVYLLTDWYVLQPGSHLADLAEQIAAALHPDDSNP